MVSKNNKQVIYLFISSILGVLLGIGVSVLNTSSLSPTEYGNVRYVNNILVFIASLLLLSYYTSGSRLLALADSKEKSRRINGALVIILGFTIFISILIVYLCYFIHLIWSNYIVANLFLVAIPVCSAPLLLNYINTSFQGDNKIAGIALARLLPSLIYLIIGYWVYKSCGATAEKMILLQNGTAIFVLIIIIISTRPSFDCFKTILKKLNNENKKYGNHVYIGAIAAVSLSYLAGITLGLFDKNNIQVGYYTLALTISTPLSLLPSIIGTVYFKKFATQTLINKKVILVTLAISFLSLLLFVSIIKPVVLLLYKEEYLSVAKIASYLAIGTTIHGLGDMFNRFLGSHGEGKCLRNGAFICGAILVIGNFIFVYLWGVNGAVLTKILSSSAYATSMIYYYIKFIK